jgi:hypothetical protein
MAARLSRSVRSPHLAFQLACLFYSSERADDCDVAADGDMLLFQWGTYDWGHGRHFEFDITRQFIPGLPSVNPPRESDFPIRQLSWTLVFGPTAELAALGRGNRWCHRPQLLPEFVNEVSGLPAFGAMAHRTADEVGLTYGDVE